MEGLSPGLARLQYGRADRNTTDSAGEGSFSTGFLPAAALAPYSVSIRAGQTSSGGVLRVRDITPPRVELIVARESAEGGMPAASPLPGERLPPRGAVVIRGERLRLCLRASDNLGIYTLALSLGSVPIQRALVYQEGGPVTQNVETEAAEVPTERLRPGRYRLTGVVRDVGGLVGRASVEFTVVRPRR
jgi:hypothetical protein